MIYNLRFFLKDSGEKHSDADCIADVRSQHCPAPGSFIYLSDYVIHSSNRKVNTGAIYKVVYRIFIYDSENHPVDDCTSVEILIKEVNM